MLTIIKANGPTSAADIDAAEQELGVRLPQQYRDFLATVGGGQTEDLDVPGAGGDGVLLEICGTDGLVRRNVTSGRGGFAANIAEHYVIIGYGSGGAPCIRTSGGDEGSVW